MTILNKLIKNYRLHIFLFLFIFLAYVAMTGGNFWEYDSFAVYKLSKSLVDRGQFSIDCFWGAKAFNGACYSIYGILMSLIIIPLSILEKITIDILKISFFPSGFFPSLTNCFVTAGLAVLIYQFLRKMNFNGKLAFFGGLLFSFGTYAPAYTKTLYAEPLLALLIFSCIYLLVFHEPCKKHIFFAGIFFGLAFLTKVSAVLFLPSVVILLLAQQISIKKCFVFFTPFVVSIAFFFVYNYLRFHSLMHTGHGDIAFDKTLISGLNLFIFSPGKSIFLYQPIIILFIFGIKKFVRKQKVLFFSLFIAVMIHFVFYGTYHWQAGDWTWGSRFLYVTMPFFIFCIMYFLRENKTKFLKILFWLFLIVSLIIQFSSIYLSYHRYYSFMNKKYGHDFSRLAYPYFYYSPLYGQWKMIFRLEYEKKDDAYWAEAFQEYPHFNTNYRIAPPDLFFLRSKKMLIISGIIFIIAELFLIKKIYEAS